MTLTELLPTVHALARGEKLRLIQILATDMAIEESVSLELADKTVPIWSPHAAFEGAATLLRVLAEEQEAS